MKFTQLPIAAVQLSKLAILDTVGVTILGARLPGPQIVARREFGALTGQTVSVFGMRRKSSVYSAALINGTSAHAELFDDNNGPMIAHPSAALVSCLLALAQERGLSGRAVIQAYAAGFEVGVKLGRLLNPTLYELGWHVTRVLGVIGCTAACANLLNLDRDRTGAAIGIAASMAGSIRQNFGTMTMALHAGLTARDAVHAATLAEDGFGSDPDAFDGKYGFFRVFFGDRPIPPFPVLGDPLELLASGIIFKLFPSGAPTLSAVDAALEIRQKLKGDLSGISRILCLVHPWNAMTLRDKEPTDPLLAKVNLRYCVAAALHYGKLGFEQFDQSSIGDTAVKELMKIIEIRISMELPNNDEFPAEVRITMADGHQFTARRDTAPGGVARPLTEQQITDKFSDCARTALGATAIDKIIAIIRNLDEATEVRTLCGLLEG